MIIWIYESISADLCNTSSERNVLTALRWWCHATQACLVASLLYSVRAQISLFDVWCIHEWKYWWTMEREAAGCNSRCLQPPTTPLRTQWQQASGTVDKKKTSFIQKNATAASRHTQTNKSIGERERMRGRVSWGNDRQTWKALFPNKIFNSFLQLRVSFTSVSHLLEYFF